MLHVAVIGAGAAGLCAARHLLQSNRTVPHVFEQSSRVGGTWVYTDQTEVDSRGEPIHSSMYKNLKTNLPKEVMAFPDFPFDKDISQSFLTHKQVLDYLEKYTDHFQLNKNIHFNTKVESVSTTNKGNWTIVTRCLNTNKTSEQEFDAVMVCNGHYSVPSYPNIPGQEKFTGKIVHSHNYRDPEVFRGENVVILGAAASGTDIAIELSKYANQVYLSHNGTFLTTRLPKNVAQIRGLSSCMGESGFLLTDGSRVQCGSVILATGYHYNFPFLSESCGITVGNNQVNPLYKHLININHPSMSFIGIPFQVCPFPQFDLQIRYFVKTLTGQATLPSQAEMLLDLEQEKEWRKNTLGFREKDLHKFGDLQWEYNHDLAKLGGEPPLNQVVEDLYREVWSRRRKNLPTYKEDAYTLIDENSFQEILRSPNSTDSEKVL